MFFLVKIFNGGFEIVREENFMSRSGDICKLKINNTILEAHVLGKANTEEHLEMVLKNLKAGSPTVSIHCMLPSDAKTKLQEAQEDSNKFFGHVKSDNFQLKEASKKQNLCSTKKQLFYSPSPWKTEKENLKTLASRSSNRIKKISWKTQESLKSQSLKKESSVKESIKDIECHPSKLSLHPCVKMNPFVPLLSSKKISTNDIKVHSEKNAVAHNTSMSPEEINLPEDTKLPVDANSSNNTNLTQDTNLPQDTSSPKDTNTFVDKVVIEIEPETDQSIKASLNLSSNELVLTAPFYSCKKNIANDFDNLSENIEVEKFSESCSIETNSAAEKLGPGTTNTSENYVVIKIDHQAPDLSSTLLCNNDISNETSYPPCEDSKNHKVESLNINDMPVILGDDVDETVQMVLAELAAIPKPDKSKPIIRENQVLTYNALDSLRAMAKGSFYSDVTVDDTDDQMSTLTANEVDVTKVMLSPETESTLKMPADDPSNVTATSTDHNDSDYVPDGSITENSAQESYTEMQNDSKASGKSNVDLNLSDIVLEKGKSSGDGKSKYVSACDEPNKSRKNACLFCKKTFTKLYLHLEAVHKKEKLVQEFIHLPKGDVTRKKLLATLRKKGNYEYNRDSIANGGEHIVERRSKMSQQRKATDYTTCPICKADMVKKSYRKHFRRCSSRKNKDRCALSLSRLQSDRVHPSANVRCRAILSVLQDDDIGELIRMDELLVAYANGQCDKYRLSQEAAMIRAKLRLLARFLKTIKELNPEITNFRSVFNPQFYDAAIEAVNSVAEYDETEDTYNKPSNASNLGTLLKKSGEVLVSLCIRQHKQEEMRLVEEFLKLHRTEFSDKVNRAVSEVQKKNFIQREVELPLDADVKKLNTFLEKERTAAFEKLQNEFTLEAWMDLAKSTMTSIQLFNRRRPGELERMYISNFEKRQSIRPDVNKELYDSLSKETQLAVNKYEKMLIRGKKGRPVSVLLSAAMIHCLLLLLQTRKQAKVPKTNSRLFGIPHAVKKEHHLNACDAMRNFAGKCGAEKPELLRATNLRKHVATKGVIHRYTEAQTLELANFLGHEPAIHKKYYRQSVLELEISRMSQVLESALGSSEDNKLLNEEDSDSESDSDSSTDEESVESNILLAMKKPQPSSKTTKTNILETPEKENSDDDSLTTKDESITVEYGGKKTSVDSKKRKRSTSPYGKTQRRRWNPEEKNMVENIFGSYLKMKGKLPKTQVIEAARIANPELKGRTSYQIKSYINNQQKLYAKKQVD